MGKFIRLKRWNIFENEITNSPGRCFGLEFNPSELNLFRTIPKSVTNYSQLFRTNPNNVLYLFWWKTVKNQFDVIRFILLQSDASIWMNPNQIFNSSQSELIWAQIGLHRITNPNYSDLGFIRIDLNAFRLKTLFGFI